MDKTPLRYAPFGITDLERLAQGWILDCEYRQMSPRTLDFRRGFVKNLLWWFSREGCETCGPYEIRAFLSYVAKGDGDRWSNPQCHGPVSSRTVRDYYTTLLTMFRWATCEGCIEQNPMGGLKPPVHRPDQIQPFTEEQIRSLVSAAKRSDSPKRDLAIVLFLLDTGVRNSELCALTLRDVDMVNKKAIVLGKGDKHRAVYFGRETSRVLWQYLRTRTTQHSDPLFTSERGRAFTRSGLLQLVERLGNAARV